ncbi:MAG: cysteine--tRNA ligase, partial [Rhodospirillaceae bacterium]|nr:cysteine--tRNA ligase [Rhodospirillaceae bacterium]
MTLHLHNTYTRQKDPFEPIDAANARMYVCGPTVYDDIHIGNARPLVVFDVLARLLRHEYGNDHVTYVRNITDVDDKIIERAAENGEEIDALTLRTTENFHAAAAAVGCMAPDVEPRATDHIAQMIVLIEDLIGKEHAYEAEGHVLFHVPSMPDYGKLSGRNRD